MKHLKKIAPVAMLAVLLAACSNPAEEAAAPAPAEPQNQTTEPAADTAQVAAEAEAAAQAEGATTTPAGAVSDAARSAGAAVNEASGQTAESRVPEDQKY